MQSIFDENSRDLKIKRKYKENQNWMTTEFRNNTEIAKQFRTQKNYITKPIRNARKKDISQQLK
jgi:malate synthase